MDPGLGYFVLEMELLHFGETVPILIRCAGPVLSREHSSCIDTGRVL